MPIDLIYEVRLLFALKKYIAVHDRVLFKSNCMMYQNRICINMERSLICIKISIFSVPQKES